MAYQVVFCMESIGFCGIKVDSSIHNPEVTGSSPAFATNKKSLEMLMNQAF